ncbi:integral membrane protein [Fusarium heterosporum]|uniref:Integral membrane protein n=1 Tax=Fusarium heterosporum TaxID=42747 RepID=A0A8H5WTK6_FUSHE|nr:integral membrane protein [Fusarium heterosporum]
MSPTASDLLISEWTLISLSTIVIAARVYLRLVLQKRKLLSSDIWMVVAWLMGIVVACFCITYVHLGLMEQDITLSLANYKASTHDKTAVRQLLWISSLPFILSFYLCKAALLCVYHQVIPVFMKKRRLFLWITVGFVVLSCITTLLLLFTICTPVSRFWALDPEQRCSMASVLVFFRTSWALNFTSDILSKFNTCEQDKAELTSLVFILPWLIVPDLMIKGYLKIGVYLTFLLGLINMAVSLVRFYMIYTGEHIARNSVVMIHFWNSLDLYIGLVIACLPALRPYFNLAAESRAFNYVTGKTDRSSRYTGTNNTSSTSGTRSSHVAKPPPAYKPASASRPSSPPPHLSRSSSYEMDTELLRKS